MSLSYPAIGPESHVEARFPAFLGNSLELPVIAVILRMSAHVCHVCVLHTVGVDSSVPVRYSRSMSKEATQTTTGVLVIGQHYWGFASDIDKAKRNFKLQGGKLSLGYTVVEFNDGLVFNGVDQMGYIHWKDEKWTEGARREPRMIEVKPRKSRK